MKHPFKRFGADPEEEARRVVAPPTVSGLPDARRFDPRTPKPCNNFLEPGSGPEGPCMVCQWHFLDHPSQTVIRAEKALGRAESAHTIGMEWAADIEAAGRDLDQRERCHADSDGDCVWLHCPQNADGEPVATGRHCPLDRGDDYE